MFRFTLFIFLISTLFSCTESSTTSAPSNTTLITENVQKTLIFYNWEAENKRFIKTGVLTDLSANTTPIQELQTILSTPSGHLHHIFKNLEFDLFKDESNNRVAVLMKGTANFADDAEKNIFIQMIQKTAKVHFPSVADIRLNGKPLEKI